MGVNLRLSIWLVVCGLSALVGLSIFWLPAPLPKEAAPEQFSADRAWEIDSAIAQKSHPAGSAEDLRVVGLLADRLSEMGYRSRRIEGDVGDRHLTDLYCVIPGTQSTNPVILLVAHHDSVPAGPGASDDGSGVSAIIETVRALKARTPLRNAIAVLFTDGEELDLDGARIFIKDHPDLIRDVKLVLNLDCRGNHGPVIMFETAQPNWRAIQLFSRACSLPVGSSMTRDVYRRMPNDTDFTLFLKAGKQGLNFAFVGGLEYYHSPQDTPQNLSRRTLQDLGDCLLDVTDYLGRADPKDFDDLDKGGNACYFNLCRGVLIQYPATWAEWLVITDAVLLVTVLAGGLWRAKLRLGATAASFGVSVLAVVLSVALGVALVIALVKIFKPEQYGPYILRLPFTTGWFVLLLIVAAAVGLGLRRLMLKRCTFTDSLAGALIPWLFMAVGIHQVAPGASYLFAWPVFFGTVALVIFIFSQTESRSKTMSTLVLTAFPAASLLAPVIALFHQTLTIGIAPMSMGLVALVLSLAPPGCLNMSPSNRCTRTEPGDAGKS